MNAPVSIDTLRSFREITQETCLTCMGRGWVPISLRDKFTGRLAPVQASCLRCNGTGRVENH